MSTHSLPETHDAFPVQVETKSLEPSHYPDWDRYVASRVDAGAYVSTSWKRAVEEAYGHTTTYLVATHNGTIVGGLPLALIRPIFGKCQLVSLPFCDFGGLFADTAQIANQLLETAENLARRHNAILEIRTADASPTLDHARDYHQITDKCRMVLQLPGSAAELWRQFKSKLRSQVKRAKSNGLEARLGGTELLPDFYFVFCRNMRDLGSPVHSQGWFQSIFRAFGTQARSVVVYSGSTPVAAGILLRHADSVCTPWASSLRQFNKLSPNMLVYWSLLEYAADTGCRCFDFGRSTPGEGTYLFKSQWGAEPQALHWFRKPHSAGPGDVPSKRSVLRHMSERIWQQMPVCLANRFGPGIRKYISL